MSDSPLPGDLGYRGMIVGWGPWRARWYSVCSAHRSVVVGCLACAAGHYVNDAAHAVGHFVYLHWPNLWRRWANRRGFPNLRGRRGR